MRVRMVNYLFKQLELIETIVTEWKEAKLHFTGQLQNKNCRSCDLFITEYQK